MTAGLTHRQAATVVALVIGVAAIAVSVRATSNSSTAQSPAEAADRNLRRKTFDDRDQRASV